MSSHEYRRGRVEALRGLAGRRWRGRGFGALPSARNRTPEPTGSVASRKPGGSAAPRSQRTAPSPPPRTPARALPAPTPRVSAVMARIGGACSATSRWLGRTCGSTASLPCEPEWVRTRQVIYYYNRKKRERFWNCLEERIVCKTNKFKSVVVVGGKCECGEYI